MSHIGNPVGLLFGLFFLICYLANLSMGEVGLHGGFALRYESKPWLFNIICSAWLTIGLLAILYSITGTGIPYLDWIQAAQRGSSESYQIFVSAWFLSFLLTAIFAKVFRR